MVAVYRPRKDPSLIIITVVKIRFAIASNSIGTPREEFGVGVGLLAECLTARYISNATLADSVDSAVRLIVDVTFDAADRSR